MVNDFCANEAKYSRGLMFSLDHGRPDLQHSAVEQVLQVTCFMCNNMMRNSLPEERQAFINLLLGKVQSPFQPNHDKDTLRALNKVYTGMAQRDRGRCSQPLRERLSLDFFVEWASRQHTMCAHGYRNMRHLDPTNRLRRDV